MSQNKSFSIRNNGSIKYYNLPIWFKYAKLQRKKHKPYIDYPHIYVKNFFLELKNVIPKINNTKMNIQPKKSFEIKIFNYCPFYTNIKLIFYATSSETFKQSLKYVLNSWFILGKFGAYNSLNLQLNYNINEKNDNLSYFDSSNLTQEIQSVNFIYYDKNSCIINVNLGTSDELSLDILINAVIGLNSNQNEVKKLIVY
mmetsp:Transcript_24584/g.43622  ORF Transcript_24584/g.43622 Transcript_24584/m.43622 type:complete len:199 (-) Transcript_24584:784-1380(-)